MMLPSLWATWFSDDYPERYYGEGSDPYSISVATDPFDLWRYFDGDPERTIEALDLGFHPWWTYDGLKFSLWRPLSAATFLFDVHVLGDNTLLAHVHSLLWFAALLALVFAVYKRFLGATWIAGLAALLYIFEDHSTAVTWVAHRNSLVAACFGLGALLAHESGYRRRSPALVVTATALFGLSILAKEEGLATFGYLAAYVICLDSGSWLKRALRLLPYFVLAVVWRWAYTEQGYGMFGVGTYQDPNDLGVFVGTAAARAPVLLGGLLTFIPADLFVIWETPMARNHLPFSHETGIAFHIGTILLFLGLIAVAVYPLLKKDRVARFFALGMLLSLAPVTAAVPTDRLLVFASLGAMGLFAQFLGGISDGASWAPDRRWWKRTAAVTFSLLVVTHMILAPAVLEGRTVGFAMATRGFDRTIACLPEVPDDNPPDQILVTAPAAFFGGQLAFSRALEGRPLVHGVRQLALAMRPVDVARVDEQTLRLRPHLGFSPPSIFWKSCRDDAHPMSVGDTIEFKRMTIVIEEVSEAGFPLVARFEFEVPLEDPSLQWLQWKKAPMEFVPFVPPAVGESILISAARE